MSVFTIRCIQFMLLLATANAISILITVGFNILALITIICGIPAIILWELDIKDKE